MTRSDRAPPVSSILILGAGYVGAALARARARGGRRRRAWPTTGTPRERAQLAELERRAPGSKPPTSASARTLARLLGPRPERVYLLAAQASRPLSEREPDYTEETNLTGARRVAEAVAAAGDAVARLRQLAARLRPRPERRGRRRRIPTASRATSRTSRRSTRELCLGMYARARRLRARAAAPRDRLRAEPCRARPPGLADGRRQVPPPGRGRRGAAARRRRSARRSASCTSTTPRASCSSRPPSRGARAANVAAETLTVGDVAALAGGSRAGCDAALQLRAPVRLRAPPRGVPAHEVPRHRRDRLPRLARGDAAGRARATTSWPRRGPGGATRAHAGDVDAVDVDAGDPAARDLLEGCDVVLHFAGVPDPAARARATPRDAVRENAGTTVNLLEGCARARRRAVYPSTVRARRIEPPPDAYALSKRLGEEACRPHRAPRDGRPPDLGLRARPGRLGGRDGRDRRVRRARAGGRADRDPRRPAPRARLRLRRRLVAALEADRRRGALGRDGDARAAGSPRRCSDGAQLVRRRGRLRVRDRVPGRRAGPRARTRPTRQRSPRRLDLPAARPCTPRNRRLCRLAPHAIPLLKAAPEPDQLAERLDGGAWSGLELCLDADHVARRRGAARGDSGRAARIWPRPGLTRHRGGAGAPGRAAPSCASTASTTRHARESSAAPRFAAAIGSPGADDPPLRARSTRRSSATQAALDEATIERVPALLRRRLPGARRERR